MQNPISDVLRYPVKYKTMQGRLLYVVFSRYGKFTNVAELLGVSRQYVSILLKEEELPLQYATLFGLRHKLSPGLFNYSAYLHVNVAACPDTYLELFNRVSHLFDPEEIKYIEAGKEGLTKKKFLETFK
jgi:hypothetical protein